jgi:hypothetical protein
MSTVVASPARSSVHAPPVWTALGRGELRRLVLHPLFLGGFGFLTLVSVLDSPGGPRDAYYAVTGAGTFFVGPFTFFAANLLASRDRRHRTAAALVACAGPMAVAAIATGLVALMYAARGAFAEDPLLLEMATGSLSVLGGGLLGVMVARWARFPGAAMLVMVGLVAFSISLSGRWVLLGAYVEFARWGETTDEWAGVIDGSRAWHIVYLIGLCAMAAHGALLVDARRKVPLFLLGVAVTAVTALAGWAQLP